MRKVSIVLVFFLVALFLAGCCCLESEMAEHEFQEAAQNESRADDFVNAPDSVLHVDARALDRAYAANEVKADFKYTGKVMAVAGTVESTSISLGNTFVKLQGVSGIFPVQAVMRDSEKERVADLNKGGRVLLLCTCGGRFIGSVSLDDCELL